MYTTFVRPHLEYASVVWDGCTLYDIEKLEKVQLAAARTITGLPIFVSREILYSETGLEPLVTRRRTAKLTTMFKVHNNVVPDYLKQIFPKTRGIESTYNTRNTEDYSIPKCRLETFKKSFVPSAINTWNSLSKDVRDTTSISKFKTRICSHPSKPPSYFSYGKRYLNITHTKLRHSSILNNDLYRRNIIDSPNCSCGQIEDVYHFFFVCKKYERPRNCLLNNILQYNHLAIVNSHLLLFGNDSLSVDVNNKIFHCVQRFIRDSGRF